MGAFGESQLADDVKTGKFVPASEMEVLEEQKKFIQLVEVENVRYLGIHGINIVAFDAILPRERDVAVKRIDNAIEHFDKEFLNSVPERHSI